MKIHSIDIQGPKIIEPDIFPDARGFFCETFHQKRHAENGIDDWASFYRIDNRIHVTIARAAGNRVYAFVLRMVHDNIQQYYEAHPLKDRQFMLENYQDLRDIITALEKRQATAVRTLMQSHVRRFSRHMNSRKRSQGTASALLPGI